MFILNGKILTRKEIYDLLVEKGQTQAFCKKSARFQKENKKEHEKGFPLLCTTKAGYLYAVV